MSRPTPWVTDRRHYIDEETDDWVEDMPGLALNLALACLGQCLPQQLTRGGRGESLHPAVRGLIIGAIGRRG